MKNLFRKAITGLALTALVGCTSNPKSFTSQYNLMSQYNRNIAGHWLTEETYQRLMEFKVSEFRDTLYVDESGKPIPIIPCKVSLYCNEKGKLESAVLFDSDDGDKFVTLEELEGGIVIFRRRLIGDVIQLRKLKTK